MSDHKKKALDAVEAGRKRAHDSLAVAFDAGASAEARVAAFKQVGSITEGDTLARALQVLGDGEADRLVRAAALRASSRAIGDDEELLGRVIAMMGDEALPTPLREAAIQVLQASSFTSPRFPAIRPAYIGALRALIDDEDRGLADLAIEYLALDKDEYVQRRLLAGLERPETGITEPERAVQYLAYDLHADHYPVLRRLAADPPNRKTRVEALRNLAADAESVPMLRSTLADKAEDPEVRHVCAVALQRLDPKDMEIESDRIIADAEEDEHLQVALINTRMHMPGADKRRLVGSLDQLAARSKEAGTREAASRLSKRMRESGD